MVNTFFKNHNICRPSSFPDKDWLELKPKPSTFRGDGSHGPTHGANLFVSQTQKTAQKHCLCRTKSVISKYIYLYNWNYKLQTNNHLHKRKKFSGYRSEDFSNSMKLFSYYTSYVSKKMKSSVKHISMLIIILQSKRRIISINHSLFETTCIYKSICPRFWQNWRAKVYFGPVKSENTQNTIRFRFRLPKVFLVLKFLL